MLRKIFRVFLVLTLIGVGILDYKTYKSMSPDERYEAVVVKTLPSVVTIYVRVSRINPETGETQTGTVLGSGVFISPRGHILTCDHLFNLPYKIESVSVEANDGTVYPAIFRVEDARRDLALVKVEAERNPYCQLARPDSLVVGEEVVAIGSPLGLPGTVTTGVISALNRDVINYDMVQMSAPINPGNSGGPLFNLKGEIVGINTNILSPIMLPAWSGLGFSVSASEINKFLVQFRGLEKVRYAS